MTAYPSGKQYEIRSGDTAATVTEVGAGLRDLRVGGRALLDGFPPEEMCSGGRGQSLLPWPNRVRDGRYRWQGQDLQLPLTEPSKGCAIHGLTRWANWASAKQTADEVVLSHRLAPQTGWLWILDLMIAYAVDEAGLTVTTTATNRSGDPAPFAAGAHPYLSAGRELVDDCTLHLPAQMYLPTDDRGIPTGVEPVEGTPYDFRNPRRIGDARLDSAYDELARDDAGRWAVRLQGQWTVELWGDASYRYAQAFTGDTLAPERRRRGLAVEPMSAPPNALQSGTDLVTLDPGGTWTGRWGIRLV